MAEVMVVNGATLDCDEGFATASLVVTSNTIEKVSGQYVATESDMVAFTNIPSFGTCRILSEAALSTCPCSPAIAAPWSPASTKHTINGLAVLTLNSKLACAEGGEISITAAGQTTAKTS